MRGQMRGTPTIWPTSCGEVGLRVAYLAISVWRISRMTVTLISPG